jgi:hypothetical protein
MEELARFSKYVARLADEGGMSGDESDHHTPNHRCGNDRQYLRVRPVWRAPAISSWLLIIDRVYISLRFQPDGRPTRGNWVRFRLPSDLVNKSAIPVKGLPENFYDQKWLATLTERERKKLKVKKTISLAHAPEIIEYVFVCFFRTPTLFMQYLGSLTVSLPCTNERTNPCRYSDRQDPTEWSGYSVIYSQADLPHVIILIL